MSTAATTRATSAVQFTVRQRILLWLVSTLGYFLIGTIGRTLKYRIVSEEGAPAWDDDHGIWVFWHRCSFTSAYLWRRRGVAVMSSDSFDGEYMVRILRRFGYRNVRGSSTRGGVRALLGMHKELEAGYRVAFTTDGPRGPALVAKPGPTLLARNTGAPVVPFYVAAKNAWVLKSWDRFVIPKPFSEVVICIGRPLYVPRDADSEALNRANAEMQAAQERVMREAQEAAGTEM